MVEIVSVLTTESVSTVLANGGTQPWALRQRRAAKCEFVVLCRDARKSRHAADIHGSAFMVGRIRAVVPSTTLPGRWLIEFAEYAEVTWPSQPFVRMPISYREADDYCADSDVCDFNSLDFKPVRLAPIVSSGVSGGAFQTTIANAKIWLAESLCLPESAIEITIKA